MLVYGVVCMASAQEPAPVGATEKDYQWWRDAKFGVFICWGPGSVIYRHGWGRDIPKDHPSMKEKSYNARNQPVPPEIYNGEYIKYAEKPGRVPPALYDNMYRDFNPTKFDADEWVRTIKEAGAGYMIFTTKHLDGFCMFDNPYTDYDVMNTPFKRDICKELADACHKHGIRIVWYYLSGDEYDDRFDATNPKPYEDYLYNSIETLLSNYGKVYGIWWDGGASKMNLDVPRIYNMMGRLQPGIISNGRIAGGKTPGIYFASPEQRLGSFQMDRPWETCAVIHDSAWYWNGGKNIKSLNTCFHMLIACSGGDGNLALNFGACSDGTIYPLIKQRYLNMGKWLKKYGESIYKTRGGPYKPGLWGVSTRRDKTVYLHVTQRWPIGTLALSALPAKVVSCKALTGGNPTFKQTSDKLEIHLDPKNHASPDTIIALTLDRDVMDIQPIDMPDQISLTIDAKVTASSSVTTRYWRGAPEVVVNYSFENGKIAKHFGEDSEEDKIEIHGKKKSGIAFSQQEKERIKKVVGRTQRGHFWRYWMPKPDDLQPWIEVGLGGPQTFQRVKLTEQYSKTRGYKLQYHDGQDWQTFHTGDTVDDFSLHLARPITAQRVRLLITKTNGESPQLKEFDLF